LVDVLGQHVAQRLGDRSDGEGIAHVGQLGSAL
jgi:hypothetical protein